MAFVKFKKQFAIHGKGLVSFNPATGAIYIPSAIVRKYNLENYKLALYFDMDTNRVGFKIETPGYTLNSRGTLYCKPFFKKYSIAKQGTKLSKDGDMFITERLIIEK